MSEKSARAPGKESAKELAGESNRELSEETSRQRLQFQDAVIERVTLNGQELEIVFSSMAKILVKDAFGFDFEPEGQCRCTITIQQPHYEFLPTPGLVNDGHVALGELCYISIFPPDLQLDCPCFLMIEQPTDDAEPTTGMDEFENEQDLAPSNTFMIVGTALEVKTVELKK